MSDPIKPVASFADWLSAPEQAAKAVSDATDGLWASAGLLGALVAGGMVALSFAKHIPVWGTMVHSIGTGLLKIIKPRATEEAEKKAKVIESVGLRAMERLESLPADNPLVKEIKSYIKENTPDEFEAIFAAWKRERKQDASL